MERSVDYIKEYLKYAIEFEKNLYIWQSAAYKANQQVSKIQNNKEKLKESKNNSINFKKLAYRHEISKISKISQDIRESKKNCRTSFVVFIIFLFISLAFGVGLLIYGLYMHSTLSLLALCFLSILGCIAVYFLTFVGPISFSIYRENKKYLEKFSKSIDFQHSIDKKTTEYNISLEKINEDYNKEINNNEIELNYAIQKQEEILAELQMAKYYLDNFYQKDIIPIKYRHFSAVATLYEYLKSGRCTIVEGHGGIYDTYEYDIRLGVIINTLSEIRDSLNQIKANQQLLYSELIAANQTLSSINDSINKIKINSTNIAESVQRSAISQQQTAIAASWMAWNSWANGN